MSRPDDKNSSVDAENLAENLEGAEQNAGAEQEHEAEQMDTPEVDGNDSAAQEDKDPLVAAQEEADKFKDLALRAEAEMENVRRRAARDVENAHKFGQEKFVKDLLPVIDSLEKAEESAGQAIEEGANKAIAEGVGLCLKMLQDVLQKSGVGIVDPAGEPFDPNLHQALSTVENPDVEPNSVVAVIQKGYTLNDRLVRPAMVMVSKAVEAAE